MPPPAPLNSILTPFFGEFMGTLVVILLGGGTNAGITLNLSYAKASGWLTTTAGWAFAFFCGVVTAIACGSPGAHLNPAVTIAVAIRTGDYSHMLSFFAGQFLGAFTGATLVYVCFADHFAVSDDAPAKRGIFCTGPAIRNYPRNLFCEVVATAAIILVIGSIGAKTFAPAGPAPGLAPYLVGIVVWAFGIGLGGTTGYALNPARDLAPRLAHALLPIPGKTDSDWAYAPIPVVGPVLGAILTGLFLRLTGI